MDAVRAVAGRVALLRGERSQVDRQVDVKVRAVDGGEVVAGVRVTARESSIK